MVTVKIESIRLLPMGEEEVVSGAYVTGPSIGACLDRRAPSPANGVVFRVFVISNEVLVV